MRGRKKLTAFDCHEALDRTYVIQKYIMDSIEKHPVIKQNSRISKKVNKAQDLLADVYQAISNLKEYE